MLFSFKYRTIAVIPIPSTNSLKMSCTIAAASGSATICPNFSSDFWYPNGARGPINIPRCAFISEANAVFFFMSCAACSLNTFVSGCLLYTSFVNTKEEILEAFQPYYQETSLTEEINVDLIYKAQKQLREFRLYNDSDIEAISKIYFAPGTKKTESIQSKISGALLPVANDYNRCV